MDIERKLSRALGRAIGDFAMIGEGERVMVAVSGGKDSHVLLYLLRELQRRAPVRFSLKAVHVDQGQPGTSSRLLAEFMAREGYDFATIEDDTYSIVTRKIPEGKTYCSLCSRLRRAILYRVASEFGCTRIALGHHREDALHTFLLNLYFAGKLAAMPPKLVSDDGRHVVVRPMIYCAQQDIAALAREKAFPIVPCNLCGSQANSQRKAVARTLDEIEKARPGTKAVMLAALGNVVPSHLLDRELWSRLRVASAREEPSAGPLPAAPDTSLHPRSLQRHA